MRRLGDKAIEDAIGETSVKLRRRAYAIAFSCAILAIWFMLHDQHINPFIRVVYPIQIILSVIFIILTVLYKVSFSFVERFSTFIIMTSVISEFFYTVFLLPKGFSIEMELEHAWFWEFLMVIQMIHLAFDTQKALRFSLVLISIIVVLGLWKFVPEAINNHNTELLLGFIRYLAFAATSFALTQVLSSSKELLSLERLRSSIDPLTGAANRRQILQILKNSHSTAHQVTVILLDLDNFKSINDRFGHDVGDHVLRETVRLMKSIILALEPRATIGRWGGEEFLIVIPGSTLSEAADFADHIRGRLQLHTFKVVDRVTASFGVSSLKPEERISSLVKRADEALYLAKSLGRNRIEISRTAPHDTADLLTTDVSATLV